MTLDNPVADLANALTEAHEKVQPMVDGLGSTEEARSVEFVLVRLRPRGRDVVPEGRPRCTDAHQLGAPVEEVRRGQPDHDLPECAGVTCSLLPASRQHW